MPDAQCLKPPASSSTPIGRPLLVALSWLVASAGMHAAEPALKPEPGQQPAAAGAADLQFHPSSDGGYEFDTGGVKGRLRAKGKSIGLSHAVHLSTNTKLDREEAAPGLFSPYRLFSKDKRYGTAAWDWPSEAKLLTNGAVLVTWPAAPEHPFTLTAEYRWVAPLILDLETTVKSDQALPAFELFLASYFAPRFTNSLAWARVVDTNAPVTTNGPTTIPTWVPARESDGQWQMFPRSERALPIVQDGRWKLGPNPVDWTLRPFLAKPLAARRDKVTDVTAVLMAPTADCIAISMPYQTEDHYSLYLSLFGKDVPAGETAKARARFQVMPAANTQTLRQAFTEYLFGVLAPPQAKPTAGQTSPPQSAPTAPVAPKQP